MIFFQLELHAPFVSSVSVLMDSEQLSTFLFGRGLKSYTANSAETVVQYVIGLAELGERHMTLFVLYVIGVVPLFSL